MVGRAQRIPIRPDVLTGVANVYPDYAVFATELGRGRDLHDSALVLATQWPVAAQLKWEHYHDQLIATRGKLTPAQADSAFQAGTVRDRKSTRLNSSHTVISYAVFCLKKKN